jgi:hypothetical protein
MKELLDQFRILCEQYRIKKKNQYQYFDLRNRNGIITVIWYGIHKDETSVIGTVLRSKHKQFKKADLQTEIENLKNKLSEK